VLVTSDSVATLIVTGSIDGNTGVTLTDIVCLSRSSTPQERITFVVSFSKNRKTSGVFFGTLGVFTATDRRGTFVGTVASDLYAEISAVAFEVGIHSTTENGVTFVIPQPRNSDAGSTLTFGMLGGDYTIPTIGMTHRSSA